ncbi:MAG: BACON domain-containing protein [Bacteroidota bacterium]
MNKKIIMMYIINHFKAKEKAIMLMGIILLFSQVFVSCQEEVEAEQYFYLEGDPTGLSVDINPTTKKYIVRSNRSWKIVPQGDDDWVKTFPDEGDDDGIFEFIIDENNAFDPRTMNFAFIVGGKEQPVLFRVDQEANVPYITIEGAENGISTKSAAGELIIPIKANVDWTYSIDDDSWLTELEVTNTEIKLQVAKNLGEERAVTLTVSSAEYGIDESAVITQSSGLVILEENFSWLNYGSAVPYEYQDEERYDNWTAEEKAMGWDVTPNEFSSYQKCTYARVGYVKLGKTNYGGDLISSNLDIVGTVNLSVTFKAAVYISSGGTIDDRILKVFALNAGTTSVSEYTIDNVPNSLAEDQAGIINDIWDPSRAYSFTITGATSATQIKFLAGDYGLAGVGQGKNRILIDDIKVVIVP